MVDKDGRPSDNVVGRNVRRGGSGGNKNVGDTLEVTGDGSGVVLSELDGHVTETVVEDGVLGVGGVNIECEHSVGVRGRVGNGQSGECLDGQSSVGAGARGDECRGNGVNHVQAEWGVVGS